MGSGIYDQCAEELSQAFAAWDFSSIFPAGYKGVEGVMIVDSFPDETIENMQEDPLTPKGMMTQPIISINEVHGQGSFRTLGGRFFDPNQPGLNLRAERFGQGFLVSSWADELLGGHRTVKKLAGQIAACVLANRISLPTFRHLRVHTSDAAYEDRPRLWVFDQHVEGDILQVVDTA